jgi:hypothetical protein
LLFDRQIIAKLVLVLLSQKVLEEFASTKNLGLHDTHQELLVIYLLLIELLSVELLLLVDLW